MSIVYLIFFCALALTIHDSNIWEYQVTTDVHFYLDLRAPGFREISTMMKGSSVNIHNTQTALHCLKGHPSHLWVFRLLQHLLQPAVFLPNTF